MKRHREPRSHTRKAGKLYRYYVATDAIRRGKVAGKDWEFDGKTHHRPHSDDIETPRRP